jgi:hypothetical protein
MTIINDTLRFLLPMLYNAKKGLNFQFFFNKFFVGAFVSDFYRPEFDYNNCILLAYKYNHSEEYINFENKMLTSLDIIETYTYDENDIQIYVVQIPNDFYTDYDNIIYQKFTGTSPDLRLNIWKMWDLDSTDNLAEILNGITEYEGESFEEQILKID